MLTILPARSLDENLHTRQGPVRTFLILARYASRTVYEEQLENLRSGSGAGLKFRLKNLVAFIKAWSAHMRVELKLEVYETLLWWRAWFGGSQVALGA